MPVDAGGSAIDHMAWPDHPPRHLPRYHRRAAPVQMSTPNYRAPLTYPVTEPKARFGLSGPSSNIPTFGIAGAAGAVALLVLVAGLIWVAATGQAPPTRHPTVFAGSLVLEDYRPLTVVDLATGAVTVQLESVDAEVGAPGYYDVQAVPVAGGTMLVNRETGMFNMLGNDDYVLGPTSTGISLGPLKGSRTAAGFADGPDAYIVRYGPRTTVSLVAPSTVEAGAQAVDQKRHRSVHALGALNLYRQAAPGARAAAVVDGSLWILVRGRGTCSVVSVRPSPKAPQGLSETTLRTWAATSCASAAVEAAGRGGALARPGTVQLWAPAAHGHWQPEPGQPDPGQPDLVRVPATKGATQFLPVAGAGPRFWFLVRGPSGWSLLGAATDGELTGPLPLKDLGPRARPAPPALSGASIYTLDQAAAGQPTIWQISTMTGRMRPVPGVAQYPAKGVTEKATFQGVQVLVNGPRVVVNNPGSLLAVVLFTDGSHKPVVIDKSTAVVVSAAGPGDVNVKATKK
ncbi:MAG TPA: hypothetical protein VFN61_07700, partial [Acidimicrobiales bacterium]|nr:hypothetical protein [Acidimicrobiales bacterium]